MPDLIRREGETELQHHKRLIYGKLVDKTLADIDYAEISAYAYGKEYSSDVARRMMYGSRETLDLLSSAAEDDISDINTLAELDMKKIELQKERQKFFDQRRAYTELLRNRSRQEELNEVLISALENGSICPLEYYKPQITRPDSGTDLLVSLNDVHFGAVVDNYWNTYNSEICATMFARYLDKILSINEVHGCENCVVWANGDMISGNIHNSITVTNKENVIDQIMGVSELISEFLAKLSPHFKTITFVSVAGNHSRIDTKDRALRDERLDDLVEWYLGARLQNFANVFLASDSCRLDSSMYCVNIRGQNYVGVHGDFDGSKEKVQALQTMVGKKIYAVLSGHKHHNMLDTVQGIKTVMAGSFLGMDDFCVTKRIYGQPEQLICVCGPKGIVCSYDAELR